MDESDSSVKFITFYISKLRSTGLIIQVSTENTTTVYNLREDFCRVTSYEACMILFIEQNSGSHRTIQQRTGYNRFRKFP